MTGFIFCGFARLRKLEMDIIFTRFFLFSPTNRTSDISAHLPGSSVHLFTLLPTTKWSWDGLPSFTCATKPTLTSERRCISKNNELRPVKYTVLANYLYRDLFTSANIFFPNLSLRPLPISSILSAKQATNQVYTHETLLHKKAFQ